jgi:2-hydroxychromene-2-carboxylate isomerase
MRLPEIARAKNTNFRWRPFHLLILLKEMNHIPFAGKPAKCAYMWRDIGRRAAMTTLVLGCDPHDRRSR